MDITTTYTLLNAIIDAYNKEQNTSITKEDIKSLVLDIPFIKVNNILVSWESVRLS